MRKKYNSVETSELGKTMFFVLFEKTMAY